MIACSRRCPEPGRYRARRTGEFYCSGHAALIAPFVVLDDLGDDDLDGAGSLIAGAVEHPATGATVIWDTVARRRGDRPPPAGIPSRRPVGGRHG